MHLSSLHLESFRNYDQLTLDLKNHQTIALVGENAQGKTNLLESVAFLALGKSFRARRYLETLNHERPHGRIRATLTDKKRKTDLEIFLQRDPETKKIKKNDLLVPPKDFLGTFRVVLFTPETLLMVDGSPSLRRQFFDRLLIQLDPVYLEAFTNYQRTLKQRNALLKRIQHKQAALWELDLWDAALIAEAEKIWNFRRRFVESIQEKITDLYTQIAGTTEKLTIHYQPQENFEENLVACRESDIRYGATTLGPHRDDFTIRLNTRRLSETGSRGECRSAVLALKIAEIHYIEEKTKQKPLLLLDDVFSELDESRQAHLGTLLKGYQSIITTTELAHVQSLPKVKIFRVERGRISE
ncbi:DNA replication/repair protein RecF [Patescibacteria group bacterium]|nr:DNA replication/repair protein RecF [Patescibacteria group bacterium]